MWFSRKRRLWRGRIWRPMYVSIVCYVPRELRERDGAYRVVSESFRRVSTPLRRKPIPLFLSLSLCECKACGGRAWPRRRARPSSRWPPHSRATPWPTPREFPTLESPACLRDVCCHSRESASQRASGINQAEESLKCFARGKKARIIEERRSRLSQVAALDGLRLSECVRLGTFCAEPVSVDKTGVRRQNPDFAFVCVFYDLFPFKSLPRFGNCMESVLKTATVRSSPLQDLL